MIADWTSMAAPFVAGAAALVVQALESTGVVWSFSGSAQPLLVKMLLDSFDETRWLAIVLSGRPAGTGPVEPDEAVLAEEATTPAIDAPDTKSSQEA